MAAMHQRQLGQFELNEGLNFPNRRKQALKFPKHFVFDARTKEVVSRQDHSAAQV